MALLQVPTDASLEATNDVVCWIERGDRNTATQTETNTHKRNAFVCTPEWSVDIQRRQVFSEINHLRSIWTVGRGGGEIDPHFWRASATVSSRQVSDTNEYVCVEQKLLKIFTPTNTHLDCRRERRSTRWALATVHTKTLAVACGSASAKRRFVTYYWRGVAAAKGGSTH